MSLYLSAGIAVIGKIGGTCEASSSKKEKEKDGCRSNVGVIAAYRGTHVRSVGWAGAARSGVCLGLELDEAKSDASMGHQWIGLVLL